MHHVNRLAQASFDENAAVSTRLADGEPVMHIDKGRGGAASFFCNWIGDATVTAPRDANSPPRLRP